MNKFMLIQACTGSKSHRPSLFVDQILLRLVCGVSWWRDYSLAVELGGPIRTEVVLFFVFMLFVLILILCYAEMHQWSDEKRWNGDASVCTHTHTCMHAHCFNIVISKLLWFCLILNFVACTYVLQCFVFVAFSPVVNILWYLRTVNLTFSDEGVDKPLCLKFSFWFWS